MSLYMIWRLDCACGYVEDFGEDVGSVPESCPECGVPAEDGDTDE